MTHSQKKFTADIPETDVLPAHFDQCLSTIDKDKLHEFYRFIDKFFQANLAKTTSGLSPAAVQMDLFSWIAQLSQSPGHLLELLSYPVVHFSDFMSEVFPDEEQEADVRFHSESWQYLPWKFWMEGFINVEKWWELATTQVPGLPNHTERSVSFFARQILDALSPSNFVMTNPDLLYETIRSGGYNLIRGTELVIEHALRKYTGAPPPGADNFIPGEDVALTPGRIVFKNHLIELIQYEPQTKNVYKEPLLFIPAWIMKYYILDLSPNNSLVNWLVQQGHTVFMISWRNPTSDDRNLGMDDYYRQGAMAAIDKVADVFPKAKINLAGYCLGGTLAMITAAAMAREGDERLNSLTLLAAEGDFSEAGELMIFINQSEVSFLKNMMWDQGYLDTKQMAGAFQMLRSYDLIWSKMVQDYMHGRRRGMIDLLAWNADATRMPYKMHSEYLEKLFLNNDFAQGKFTIEGKYVMAENIQLPTFAVSTENDHVAPWPSVYKVHFMINHNITFVLTKGGHNAGIISEPGHKDRYYRIREQRKDKVYLSPQKWLVKADKEDGSWWPCLHEWLLNHSSEKKMKPPKLDTSLPAAPGSYVMQK